MEEELGMEVNMSLEQELAAEAQCAKEDELELRPQPTPLRIQRLEEELGAVSVDHKQRRITTYEIANVGAGIGGGIGHTQELNVKKYNEAMDGQDATK